MPRILAFSDIHRSRDHALDLVARAEEADLVIGAGDFATMRKGLEETMALFAPIEERLIVVPGNAESAEELSSATGAVVLHGQSVTLNGLTIFGIGAAIPRTPFGEWSFDLDEDAAATMLAAAAGADILISHSPPKGLGDVTRDGRSLGSTALRAAIEAHAPRLVLCGHIHDSWGARGKIGTAEVANLGPDGAVFEL